MMPPTAEKWIAVEATVVSCRYQARALSALAFGFRVGEKFRIGFEYYAHGQLYSGEFDSPYAIPQNERLWIRYDPLHPERNTRDEWTGSAPAPTGKPRIWVGVAGSVVLSLLWFAYLRGCFGR